MSGQSVRYRRGSDDASGAADRQARPLTLTPLNRRRLENFRNNKRGYLVVMDLSRPFRPVALCRVHRQ